MWSNSKIKKKKEVVWVISAINNIISFSVTIHATVACVNVWSLENSIILFENSIITCHLFYLCLNKRR